MLLLQGPANVDAVAALIELGANFNTVLANSTLESPLHIAARSGRLDILERLLKCKVPIDVRAKVGLFQRQAFTSPEAHNCCFGYHTCTGFASGRGSGQAWKKFQGANEIAGLMLLLFRDFSGCFVALIDVIVVSDVCFQAC